MTHQTSIDIEAPQVHHASHRKMNSMSSNNNETGIGPEDKGPAARQNDAESPPPIEAACLTANKSVPKAIDESQDETSTTSIESPRKIDDAPRAMATEKVQPILSPHDKESNCMANTSIILGIISLFFFGLLFGVLAIIFAIVAFRQIKREPHRFKAVSNCRAMQGMFVGFIGVFISVIIFLAFTL